METELRAPQAESERTLTFPQRLPQTQTLERKLSWLTLGTLLPFIIFAMIGAVLLAQREQTTFERGARERTLAVLTAIDADLRGSITTLEAVAASRSLDHEDFAEFYADATRVMATQPDWVNIILALPSGQQVINLSRPLGASLPPVQEPPSLERVVKTGLPAVGDLAAGSITGQIYFPVRVPVKRDGAVRYVLTAVVSPQSIYNLWQSQQLPSNWIGVVVDRNKRFVARTVGHSERLGQLASKDLQAALNQAPQGWVEGRTVEGTRVYTAHHTSSFSGWSVALGVPAAVVEAAAWQATLLVLFGTLGAVGLAYFTANMFGRKIAQPIRALAESAHTLARGETTLLPSAGDVTEVAELSRALGQAGEAVHARIELQRQLQAVTANATVALFMIDANDLCTFMNPAAERLTGYSFSEVRGRTLHEVVHHTGESKATHSFVDCAFTRAFVAGTTRQGHDVLIHKDGHFFDVAYAASPLLAAGVNLGAVIEVRDVTIEKTLEAARRALLENEQRARSEAEASNRAKDEFLAMLGHELRNPLAAITNASHLLGNRRTDQLPQAREVIQRQSAHLARLVDDLLDAARVASGKIVLALGPVELGEVVSRTLATLTASGRTQRHRISLNLEPTWVLGDETRLEQIVTNLATNALRYTPAGGHIEFQLTSDGNEAVLSVTDSGIGIPAAMLPNVFDLFMQGDRGLERAHGGLGIGLTLVKRLTELHGGTADAASAGVDRGSTFTIRLPCISAPTTQQQSMLPLNRTSEERRVLLIEDNADARAMLRTILELAGHAVTERPDGPSGLTAALDMRPDVALIDIGLPGLNGYDVARGIRESAPEHPIRLIAISGYGQPQDRAQALQAGFDAHLVKPVEPDRVLREVAITSQVLQTRR